MMSTQPKQACNGSDGVITALTMVVTLLIHFSIKTYDIETLIVYHRFSHWASLMVEAANPSFLL